MAWSSKKQSTVALSTAEAEYVATTHCAKQVIWHRSLLNEVGISLPSTSTIFSDNQAAISIAHHLEHHVRTKHIDNTHHFLCDLVQNGTLNLVYVNTQINLPNHYLKWSIKILHTRSEFSRNVQARGSVGIILSMLVCARTFHLDLVNPKTDK